MSTIRLTKLNEATLRITSDDEGVMEELSDHFSFYVPGYRYMPLFRNKLWDGKHRLVNKRNGTIALGLLDKVVSFATSRQYKVELQNEFFPRDRFPERHVSEIKAFIASLPITTRGKKIEPRDYQIDAVVHSIMSTRTLCLSPTGSGKSLIIYLMIRWWLKFGYINDTEKIILICPTTALVSQMQKDFMDYSSTDKDFNAAEETHVIYAGKEKMIIKAPIVITTWQSAILIKSRAWFEQFGMMIIDEAHNAKGKSLTTIADQLVNARYRFGTTGTLDGAECNELIVRGSTGPIHKVTTTKDLMNMDMLAQLQIKLINLKYDPIDCRAVKGLKYDEEIKYLIFHQQRCNFISKLAVNQKGNTLVLFNLVEKHGVPLYERIKSMMPEGRNVYYVSGSVDVDDRERIRSIVEKETGAVIVASSGTMSTGVNLRNLHNIIFSAPSKSQIKVLQSIGRGLRKSDNGQDTILYDIVDDLRVKSNSKPNYALAHGMHRVGIYEKEKFTMSIHEYKLKP